MKLILTADVDHLGSVGDTVEVKDGYGRNFLLPRGLAIVASRGAQKQADDIRRARDTKRSATSSTPTSSRPRSRGWAVSLPVKTAGDSGKLFGSVTAGDVVTAIKKAGGPNLDKRTSGCPRRTSRPSAATRSRCSCTPRSTSRSSLDVVAESLSARSTSTPGWHPDRPSPGVLLYRASELWLASSTASERNRPLTPESLR